MSARNGAEVADAVSTILTEEYSSDFDPIYAVTLRATNNILTPQPINEIRNFTGHLANALVESDPEEVQLELARALRHVRLATYDALLITLLEREDYLVRYLNGVEESEGQQSNFRKDVAEIATKRREIPRIEPSTESDMETIKVDVNRTTEANEMLESAITKCNEVAKALETKFAKTVSEIERAGSKAMAWFERRRVVQTVWAYAGGLFVLLAALELLILRSWQMLLAVAGVCLAGALIGTYIALTDPQTEPSRRSARSS